MGEEHAPSDLPAALEGWDPAAAMALVAASFVLGGASRENLLRLMVVELVSLPLLALALRAFAHRPRRSGPTFPLILLGLVVAVPVLQLIPLPADLWTRLPGRGAELEALSAAGLRPAWAPASLAPDQTLNSALALAPPVAMFLGGLGLGAPAHRALAGLWLILALAGLALGAAQLAAPAAGPVYLYATTNPGSLVGFFANRNHEASFLLAVMPLAVALAKGARPMAAWLLGLFCLLAIVGLGVIGSRAGVLLAGPAILACLAIAWRSGPAFVRPWGTLAAAGAACAAVAGVALLGPTPILQRFGGHIASEFRFQAWPQVIAAADPFLPLGAGVGAFDRVFRAAEPLEMVGPTYFNHAHNDYLELWLETGWIGAALLAAFLIWLARAGWSAWARGGEPGASLRPAAAVTIILLLLHSAVDYPLRTTALATLFAFCCAVLAAPGHAPPPAAS